MGNNSGIGPRNPTKYLGANVYLNIIVSRNYQPTGADYRQPETGLLYQVNTLWQVGKNPTTGTEGQIYILTKIVANIAYWQLLAYSANYFTWAVTITDQTLSPNMGFFANSNATLEFSLPTNAAVGDTYEVIAMGSGGFLITQSAGQSVVVGNQLTTSGAGGSIASTSSGDWIKIVCDVAGTSFFATVEQGNLIVT